MAEVVEMLHFSISGEFVTDLSRQWFWDEDRGFDVAAELLANCLVSDEITDEERNNIIVQILEGRKKLCGVNSLTLEDDNELIRPLSDKIKQQERKLKINAIKDHIEVSPLLYVDKYVAIKSYETLKELHPFATIDEVYEWYCDEENPELSATWLFNKASLIYDLIGGPITTNNRDEFFRKLNDHLDDRYPKRKKAYEMSQNIKPQDLKEEFSEEDYIFGKEKDRGRNELHELIVPDKYLSEYAWINRYGEWYSCNFGGHTMKAVNVVAKNEKLQKEMENWITEKGGKDTRKITKNGWVISGYDLYVEFLLEKGWVKFHNPHGGECYPEYYLKPTKEQNQAMFDASIHFDYKKIRGLED